MSLSDLLGLRVRDPGGAPVGTVCDLIVAPATDYPPVMALVVKSERSGARCIPWSAVATVEHAAVLLGSRLDETVEWTGPVLSLTRQVLDRQVIDTRGARVVRVNDLQLAELEDGGYRVVGIDVGNAGLVRRLGLSRPLTAVGFHPQVKIIPFEGVEPIESGSAGVHPRVAHADLALLRPADIATILSQLDPTHASEVLEGLDDSIAANSLGELGEPLQTIVLQRIATQRAADIVEEMDPDEAADLLAVLQPAEAADLLGRMAPDEAAKVQQLLAHPEDSAGGLMTTQFLTVHVDATVREALHRVRTHGPAVSNLHALYVVDGDDRLVGSVSLRDLMVAEPEVVLREIVAPGLIVAGLDNPATNAVRLIARYRLLSLPIVDSDSRLRGVVTVEQAMRLLLPDDLKAHPTRMFRRT